MEAHPVPQNVTSFEFHLVGDMTVKQFGYLATGLGIAYIIFISTAAKAPLIAWPLQLFFALSGVAFAFLPISNRPLDHWVNAFFKAVFSPTQRSWKSPITHPENVVKDRLRIYLGSHFQTTPNVAAASSILRAPNLSAVSQMAPKTQPLVSQKPAPAISPTPAPVPAPAKEPPKENLPSPKELEQTVELAKKAQEVQSQIVATEHELESIKQQAANPGVDPKEFAEDFQKVLGKLQSLTKEATDISHQIAVLSNTPIPSPTATPVKAIPVARKPIVPNIVLTSTPNIINGIVTDSQNNYLEGVIVVTHDKQGLPVRALKTNKLGQFVAATPLPNGVYLITLEKENLVFDNIQIELTGKVLSPIVIAAKGGTNG